MSFEWSVAKRFLWAARKERHTAFLSLISMLGLAVGVATLIISLALLSGLQGQIKGRLIASSPQLLIEPAGGNTIEPFVERISVRTTDAPSWRNSTCVLDTSCFGEGTRTSRGICP